MRVYKRSNKKRKTIVVMNHITPNAHTASPPSAMAIRLRNEKSSPGNEVESEKVTGLLGPGPADAGQRKRKEQEDNRIVEKRKPKGRPAKH